MFFMYLTFQYKIRVKSMTFQYNFMPETMTFQKNANHG